MIKFKIITDASTYGLAKQIAQLLNNDWELSGGMSCSFREVGFGGGSKIKENTFYQSMIKH
tara:strand:- start:36898 stop:37080 length:183 start_codon:yes stop_codon:yes gene_type:complete